MVLTPPRGRSPNSTTNSDKSLVVFFFLGGVVLIKLTSLDFVENDLVGSLEGVLETRVEGVVTLGAHSLLLAASLGVLGLKSSLAGNLASLVGLSFKSGGGLGEGVKALHKSLVLEGVLVVGVGNGLVVADFAEL